MQRSPLHNIVYLLLVVSIVLIDAASWVSSPQPAGYTGDESTASLTAPCGNDTLGFPSATPIRFGVLKLELASNSSVTSYSLSIAHNETDFATTDPFFTCASNGGCSLTTTRNTREVVIPWDDGGGIIQYQANSEDRTWFNCFAVEVESGPLTASEVIGLTNRSISFGLIVKSRQFVFIQTNFLYSIETTRDNSNLQVNFGNSERRSFDTLLSNAVASPGEEPTELSTIATVDALNATTDPKITVTYINPIVINSNNPSATLTSDYSVLVLEKRDGGLVGLQSVTFVGSYTYNELYEPDSTMFQDSRNAPNTQCLNVESFDQYFFIRRMGDVQVQLDTTRPCADEFFPYFPTSTHFVIYIILLAIGIFFSLVLLNPCFQDLMRKGQIYDGKVTAFEMEIHYTKETTTTYDRTTGRVIDKKTSTCITGCDCNVDVAYGDVEDSFNGCCLCCFDKLKVLAYPDKQTCCAMLYYKGWMGYIFSCILGVGPIVASGVIAFINMGILGELQQHGGAALQFFLGLISFGIAGVFVIPWWKIPGCKK